MNKLEQLFFSLFPKTNATLVLVVCAFHLTARAQQMVNGNTAADNDFFAVENKLIPNIVLESEKNKTYTLEDRLKFYKVPGASIVVFEKGKIMGTKVYGFANMEKKELVTPHTKFQVASISKSVTALGVLKLVEIYKLSLDANVNEYLTSWKIPENEFTIKEKVTIRRLLNHTAGINIGGFNGYKRADTIPTLDGILNGKGNTPPIRVESIPGTKFSYSGGGYVILAKLIEDISGKTFKTYMEQIVFAPLQMNNSSFDQYPSDNISFGYNADGKATVGGWKIMPELAPDGLWTTPTDLAKLCIAVQNSLKEEKGAFINQAMVKEMLTPSPFMAYGLGVGIKQQEEINFFFHAGQNPGGFSSMMINMLNKEKGIVIETNSEDVHLMREITNAYANQNKLGYARGFVGPQTIIKPLQLNKGELKEFTGMYKYDKQADLLVEIRTASGNKLEMKCSNEGDVIMLIPNEKNKFIELSSGLEAEFSREEKSGKIISVTWNDQTFIKSEK